MSNGVQLVFLGEVLAGFRPEDVQRELGRLLKADEAKLRALFSGRRAVLKRDLPEAEAPRYVARLAAVGARVHVEPMVAAAAATAAPSAASSGWPTIAPPEEELRQPSPPPPAPPPVAARPIAEAAATLVAPATAAAATATTGAAASAPRELSLEPIAAPEEVTCPNCGERQSKRLLCRACATNIEMALAAKAEEAQRQREERQAMLEARRQRRSTRVSDDGSERSAWPIGFSFSGRVGRLTSATAGLWLLTALFLLSVGFLQRPSLPRMLLLGAGLLAVFFFSMRLTVLRCHDCGRHGWWALFVLVPYAGNLASLLITFLPGNPEANEYGPRPPRGRWRWLFLALLALAGASVLLVRATVRFVEREDFGQEEMQELMHDGESAAPMLDLGSTAANEAFQDYTMASGHKAFAVSANKGYGWAGSAGSIQEAARKAWSECQSRREPYTANCRIVNVDGQWVREQ